MGLVVFIFLIWRRWILLHKKFNSSNTGFSLIEVLITITVLGLGIFTLTQVFSKGILTSTDADQISVALEIAQTNIETIKDTAFASVITSGSTADSTFSDYDVTVTVTGSDPKTVVVKVEWDAWDASAKSDVELTTLVSDV
ncbi:MAG: prepilin-type N-terminal cleavage/methylation domain-containing protein [Candidatus Omnitrophota bacterium]|jgi:prepilin-type N-terminal cleavage/methylation domain-containing protein